MAATGRAHSVLVGELADLGDVAGPAFRRILMPVEDLGAAKIGITDQFLNEAGTYHQRYFDVPYFRFLIRNATANRLEAAPSVILDIGSGSGNSVLPCLELFPNSRIIATDLSERLLALLRDHVDTDPAARNRLELICLDATRARFVPESVDLVVGAAILHHLIDPATCVRQACRALRPGGYAIFFEPFENGNAILRLAYERILEINDEASSKPDGSLRPEIARILRMYVVDLDFRKGTDKSAPAFQGVDDKWLFTKSYFQRIAADLGNVSVEVEPLNVIDQPFVLQTRTNLRLSLGLSNDEIEGALPRWAWNILQHFDRTFSRELKLDLPIEACVIFKRARP